MSSAPPLDLDITIVSAKHLKNVNWRNGNLAPYAVFWLDPNRRISTKSDDYGSTKPVWNERFLLPLPPSPPPHLLTLQIFHSHSPNPLVGSVRVAIPEHADPTHIGTFVVLRPSGRPQGKIRLKLALVNRPVEDYRIAPPLPYYYNHAQPSRPPQHSDTYPPAYYPPHQPTPRPVLDRQGSYGRAPPSAPVDMRAGLEGAMGRLLLDDRAESHLGSRYGYSDYRGSYNY